MSSPELQVVYQDDALLVLDKPAGLLSVPGRGADKQDCLSTRARRQFADALVVHRLDMATSGLMIMARSTQAQRILGDAFASRAVTKRYVAVVDGQIEAGQMQAGQMQAGRDPAGDSGWHVIDLPIGVDWPNRPLRIIDTERGKPSLTRWRVLAPDSPWQASPDLHPTPLPAVTTRLELEPLTGRSHQLRVHLKALGHPIVGDALYASEAVQAQSDRLLLHACALTLNHPVTGVILSFQSAPIF